MHKNKKRVLVAMSGGVDSSVALIKILEMGYEAIGVTLKLWENRDKKTFPRQYSSPLERCYYLLEDRNYE
jgi:tRNA U34 2-thiouridine synthase MnmA/TrmU